MNRPERPELAPPLRRFKPYPAYKDSGVEWLGQIPAHWEVARLSELTSVRNGYPFDAEYFVREEGIPLVRIRDLSSTETEVNYIGPVVEEAWINPGDVIVGMDGDFNVARWNGGRALLNQRLCCLTPRSEVDAGFVAHSLPLPLKVINDLTHSTTVKHLSSGDVRKVRLAALPVREQRAITAFLNRETTRIDELIAKKELLIDRLLEERGALIARAVTKGLERNVPMKDSGVEWLGEIPAHWDTRQGRYLYRVVQLAPQDGDGVITAYREVTLRENRRAEGYTFAIQEIGYQRVRAGDLVIQGMDAFAGAIGVSDSTGKCSPEYLVLDPVNEGTDNRYFAAALRLMAKRGYIFVVCNAVRERAPRFRVPEFRSVVLPAPPSSEQRAIADFLDRETARIDGLIARIRGAIERLKELRTSLISDAVTGKIDVRQEVG